MSKREAIDVVAGTDLTAPGLEAQSAAARVLAGGATDARELAEWLAMTGIDLEGVL